MTYKVLDRVFCIDETGIFTFVKYYFLCNTDNTDIIWVLTRYRSPSNRYNIEMFDLINHRVII